MRFNNKLADLADKLDELGYKKEADSIDTYLKRAALELQMEKEVEEKESKDEDKDAKNGDDEDSIDVSKKKTITLKFD